MKKTILLLLLFGMATYTFSQVKEFEKYFSLARVGKKIHGVYVFIRTTPYYRYDHIAEMKIKLNWDGGFDKGLEKTLKKAKKNTLK